jgi:D-tagatose-1,6-bisphosphate aldolase subunit GatZ/KbaZ
VIGYDHRRDFFYTGLDLHMTTSHIELLISAHDNSTPRGITAICSAHPAVLEAALDPEAIKNGPVLIEATCNQVNQDGGYTGMTPADFRAFVFSISEQTGFPKDQIILGGDHLGPNPWRHLPSDVAMEKAKVMIAAFANAGFTKIHLDASMSCADDPEALSARTIAERSAELAAVAEAENAGQRLIYVIGTEVPPPGGATEHIETLSVTPVSEALETVELHRVAFAALGIEGAFDRVVGLVVQPGVEFGNANVIQFNRPKAQGLSTTRKSTGLIFEAHSTDYQTPASLAALVEDGFAILKVGPWLTFALREALYALDSIAQQLGENFALQDTLETAMCTRPADWDAHYHGTPCEQKLQRHFSYSDRIRYYWAQPDVALRVDEMMAFFKSRDIPQTLVSQYFPMIWPEVATGETKPDADQLLIKHIQHVISLYAKAI